MRNRAVRLATAGALSLGVVAWAGPAQAATTATQTVTFDLGDLDESGTGQIEQFDPALGELTSVAIDAEVTMDFAVCVTNLSEEAASVNDGAVSGTADLSFAGDLVANTSGAMSVPGSELSSFDGTDGCADWLDAGGDPATDPVGANSTLTTGSDTDTWSTSITDADALAPYVGTGTVGFDYTAASASDLAQPSEWTLVFLASGAGEVNVTYTYEPGGEVGGICEENSGDPDCDEGDVSGLPDTGGPIGWLLPLGAVLVLVGAGMVMVRRPHSA
ncbi:MAG TPA: choice-of-anchor E domain-containing protein [Nocardioides sp.]|nr:choice-of-anchor E domain-containing protein [Nocardioides sp.]